jgi:hypothetical protein
VRKKGKKPLFGKLIRRRATGDEKLDSAPVYYLDESSAKWRKFLKAHSLKASPQKVSKRKT